MGPVAKRVLALWKQGKDTHDIARELGVHEAYIANSLCAWRGRPAEQEERKTGAHASIVMWSVAELAEIARWRRAGWSRKRCAWRLGVGLASLPAEEVLRTMRVAS